MLILSGILIAVMLLASLTLSLIKGGFDEPNVLAQFQYYQIIGTGFLMGVIIFFIIELFILKDDNKFGNSLGFSSLGEFPAIPLFKRFTILQITLLSIIFFGILGILNFTLTDQKTFTGVGTLSQQFTATDSILFSSFVIPIAENLGAAFVIVVTFFILRYLGRKYDFGKGTFSSFALILIPIITGLFGLAWHLWRYSGSELDLITVFIFWTIGGFITVVTGVFTPFWIMHLNNNLLFDLSRFFSNETVLITAVVISVIMVVVYVFVYSGRLLGGKKVENV